MNQIVFWGLDQYNSTVARGAKAGLVAQSKALLLKEWRGYSNPAMGRFAGTGRYAHFGQLCRVKCFSTPTCGTRAATATASVTLCIQLRCPCRIGVPRGFIMRSPESDPAQII